MPKIMSRKKISEIMRKTHDEGLGKSPQFGLYKQQLIGVSCGYRTINIARVPEGNHQLAQFGNFREQPANARFQQQELPLDGLPAWLLLGLWRSETSGIAPSLR
jgi:hypothetical protein